MILMVRYNSFFDQETEAFRKCRILAYFCPLYVCRSGCFYFPQLRDGWPLGCYTAKRCRAIKKNERKR